jgi:hypothetical protein
VKYSAELVPCEGGPCTTQHCAYGSDSVTVTGGASNTIHIETCTLQVLLGGSCGDDAAAAGALEGHSCSIPGVIDAELVTP